MGRLLKSHPGAFSSPEWTIPTLPGCLRITEVLQPWDYCCGLLWTHYSRSMSFLCWGPWSWTQHLRWGLTRAEETSLDLLPCCFDAAQLSLGFLGCQGALSGWASHPPTPPCPSLQGCSQSLHLPAYTCAWDHPNPCTGSCSLPHCTSWMYLHAILLSFMKIIKTGIHR